MNYEYVRKPLPNILDLKKFDRCISHFECYNILNSRTINLFDVPFRISFYSASGGTRSSDDIIRKWVKIF